MKRFFLRFRYLVLSFTLLLIFSAYALSSHPELRVLLTSSTTAFKMSYRGHVDATPKGETMRGFDIVLRNPKTRAFVLGTATARFKGKFTPDVPGSSLPSVIELLYQHKSAKGKIKAETKLDLKVASDGRILQQDFQLATLDRIVTKDSVEFSESPKDADLPAGTLKLSAAEIVGLFTSKPQEAVADEEDSEDPNEEAAATPVKRISFSPYVFADDTKKGSNISSFDMKILPDAGLALNGHLIVKGFLGEGRPPVFPGTINIVVDHIDPQTKETLFTDTLPMKVETNGTIKKQIFPFSSNADGIPEFLRISFVPADADFFHSRFAIKFTFVQSS